MNEIRAKIEEIALYLGAPWRFNRLGESSKYHLEIIDGAGRVLFFRTQRKKFQISGHFPANRTIVHRKEYKTIGVSVERSAKHIAADIQRRLLPHYAESYESAKKRYIERKSQEQKLDHIAQALNRLGKGKIDLYGRGSRTIYFDRGHADLWSDETISMSLNNLSAEKAIQIIALMSG